MTMGKNIDSYSALNIREHIKVFFIFTDPYFILSLTPKTIVPIELCNLVVKNGCSYFKNQLFNTTCTLSYCLKIMSV